MRDRYLYDQRALAGIVVRRAGDEPVDPGTEAQDGAPVDDAVDPDA